MLVSRASCVVSVRVVVEEKIFPASVWDCVTFCLGGFRFVSPPVTRNPIAAVIRRSTIINL